MGLGLALLSPSTVQARTFQCRAGDVACLIESITQANAQPGSSHDIRLAAGVYTLTAVENETEGPNGLPSITRNLTIRGEGEDVTILERNINASLFRLIHVAATGALTLEGLTLRGGGDFLSFRSHGGGLYNAGGRVTILNSTFVHNAGYASGGLYSAGGTVTIRNSTVADNSTNADFPGGAGGGLFVTGGATVTISASTITGNGAYAWGGGLYIDTGATVTITNSAIVGNGTIFGGGGLLNAGTVMITNSTIARNRAIQGFGGGISGNSTTRILNSTIVDNHAANQVGILAGGVIGPVALQNTLVAHNTSEGFPSDCRNTISLGHNLIGDLTGCTMTLLPSDLTGEPELGAFLDNETPGYGHYPLLPGSLAINRGNPAVCPKTDQLGEKRVEICDIGAIEFQGEVVSSR